MTNGGLEYALVMATVAAVLAFAGPGAMSLDRALAPDLAGSAWGVIAVGLGLGAATVTLASRRTPEEMAMEEEERRRAA